MEPLAEFFEQMVQRDPTFRRNTVQVQYAQDVLRAAQAGPGRVNFFQADTGIGKTLGYLCAGAAWHAAATQQRPRQIMVSTHSRALQRQIMVTQDKVNDFRRSIGAQPLRFAQQMGRMNYVNPERVATMLQVADEKGLAEVAADENRTRAERDLASWTLRHPDGSLLDYPIAELPDDIAVTDISIAPQDALPESLAAQFETNGHADVLILNHALLANWLAFTPSKLTKPPQEILLILDEAEHFPEVAEKLLSRRISFRQVARIAQKMKYSAHSARWDHLLSKHTSAHRAGEAHAVSAADRQELSEALLRLSQSPRQDPDSSKDAALWNELREQAPRMRKALQQDDPVIALGYSPVMGVPVLHYANRTGGAILQRDMENRATILTSATLSDMNRGEWNSSFGQLQSRLLLKKEDTRIGITETYSPTHFGQLSFTIRDDAGRPLEAAGETFRLTEKYTRAVVEEMLRPSTDKRAQGRVLVLCASYADQHRITAELPASEYSRVVAPPPGTDLNVVANHLPEHGVLITPGGWEGLSPERQENRPFWSRIVLVRVPIAPINPVQILADQNSMRTQLGYTATKARRRAEMKAATFARIRATQRLRQGIGRALRHPDDECEIVVLDPRFVGNSKVGQELRGYTGAIPKRFAAQFEAALRDRAGDEALKIAL